MQLENVLRKRAKREEEVTNNASPPAQLLLEKDRQCIGDRGPAERVVIDVGTITAQKCLVCQKSVFTLVNGNAKPMARANRGFDFQKQFAANGEQATTDAANTTRPIFRDLIEFECSVINDGLDRSNDVFVGIADPDAAAN